MKTRSMIVTGAAKGKLPALAPTEKLALVGRNIGKCATAAKIVVYLTEARHMTGEVLHVDAGAHNGKW